MRMLYRAYLVLALVLLVSHFLISRLSASLCNFNSGIALGMLGGLNSGALIVIGVVALAVVIAAFKTLSQYSGNQIEYGIMVLTVLAGLSNIVDRILHGGVCDYISIPYWEVVINLNDLVLSLNVIFLLFIFFKYGTKDRGDK